MSEALEEQTIHVVDTTVLPGEKRVHELTVEGRNKAFAFEHNTPLELPFAIAMKFLHITEFIATDEKGEPKPFLRTPTQPEELQAGQRFRLADNETVARYDELTLEALLTRAALLPGGEAVKRNLGKDKIAKFIEEAAKVRRLANVQSDTDPDSFVPEPDLDEMETV